MFRKLLTCLCLCLQFSSSSISCTDLEEAQRCRLTRAGLHSAQPQPALRQPPPRPILSVLLSPSEGLCHINSGRIFRCGRGLAAGWRVFSSSASQLQVTGCMPIMLIKRSLLLLGDEYVSDCSTECQTLCPDATWMSCNKTGDGPRLGALHGKHSPLAWVWSLPFVKAPLGRVSDVSSTVLTFSALTQKQNSFNWLMLNAQFTHPSFFSVSYFSFPIDLCHHKKICEMWAQYNEDRRSDISLSLKAFSATCKS